MTIAYLNVATDRQHLDIQREEISSFAAAKDIHVDNGSWKYPERKRNSRDQS